MGQNCSCRGLRNEQRVPDTRYGGIDCFTTPESNVSWTKSIRHKTEKKNSGKKLLIETRRVSRQLIDALRGSKDVVLRATPLSPGPA